MSEGNSRRLSLILSVNDARLLRFWEDEAVRSPIWDETRPRYCFDRASVMKLVFDNDGMFIAFSRSYGRS
jgi:hypothetical protein